MMKKMNKQGIVFGLFLLSVNLGALGLDDVLPGLSPGDRAVLTEKKELVRYSESRPKFAFLPSGPLSDRLRKEFEGFDPTVTDEVLFLMPLPIAQGDRNLFLYNKIRDVGTLSGIQYHSSSKDGMRTLFSDVYAVDSLKGKKKMPFVPVMEIPAEARFPLHMEDANFGSGYYEASYFHEADRIAFGLRNLTTLKYVFPILREQKVRFHILFVPLENELLMYGIVAAEAGGFVRYMVNMPCALGKRIRALRDWFTEQVYEKAATAS
jgi:hypothetical protein